MIPPRLKAIQAPASPFPPGNAKAHNGIPRTLARPKRILNSETDIMKNTFRSTALALLSSGLLVAGVAACGEDANATESGGSASEDTNDAPQETTETTADETGGSENVEGDTEEGGTDEGGSEGGDAEGDGFTGTLSGEVEYLAPGEYIVDGQAFFVSEETEILGGLYTCASDSAGDTGSVECPFDEFDEALADGTVVLAGVEVQDGIAESITEFQA